MLGWMRRSGERVVHTVAPEEPGMHAKAYADREKEIKQLDKQIREAWSYGETFLTDWLLDQRNDIRPARVPGVPVIPGEAS